MKYKMSRKDATPYGREGVSAFNYPFPKANKGYL